MLSIMARILLAAAAAFFVAWGIYLIVEPPEAGRWIGALLVVLGASCVLPAFSRRGALR